MRLTLCPAGPACRIYINVIGIVPFFHVIQYILLHPADTEKNEIVSAIFAGWSSHSYTGFWHGLSPAAQTAHAPSRHLSPLLLVYHHFDFVCQIILGIQFTLCFFRTSSACSPPRANFIRFSCTRFKIRRYQIPD